MDLYVNSQASSAERLPNGFMSAKTSERIVYPKRWHQYALIQLTLDPRVERISPRENRDSGYFSVFVEFSGGERRPTIFSEAENEIAASAACPTAMVLLRTDVYAEPKFSTCRAIWKARATPIGFADRLRILAAMPTTPRGMTVAEAARMVRSSKAEGFDCVARLISDGDLCLDLNSRIGLETQIHSVSQMRAFMKNSIESNAEKWPKKLDFLK